MKTFFLSFVVLLHALCSVSQTVIQGSVRDAVTNEELPWCSISVKGTKKGAITNSEGNYIITVKVPEDTLLFSYVGYKPMEISSYRLSQKSSMLLERTGILLEELTVHADNGYLYDIVTKCRKNMLKDKYHHEAKVYYGIETQTKEQPIELLECYYNGCLKGSVIENLLFRNGRIGFAELDQRYFLTLNSSKAISQMNLVLEDAHYPSIPLQLSWKNLKKIFRLTMEPGENGMYHIGFQPIEDIRNHFSGDMWIDRTTFDLVKIDLEITDAARHPFVPIFRADRLSNVDLQISLTFKNVGSSNNPDHINFRYQVNYSSIRNNPGGMDPSIIQREIATHGVLYFYDYDDPFIIPRFEYDANYDDYRKMSIIPFNKVFWDNNNTMILTGKQKENLGFFASNGLLINFKEGKYGKEFLSLTHYDSSLYENYYTFWDSSKRFSLNRSLARNRIYTPKKINGSILTNLYNLEVQLLLDVTRVGPEFSFKSYTVFDENKSSFHLPEEPNTMAFLNIFFDLCEIERRKMEHALYTTANAMEQIDSIYQGTRESMKILTAKYLKEVKLGKSKSALEKWNAYVLERLDINNVKLSADREDKF